MRFKKQYWGLRTITFNISPDITAGTASFLTGIIHFCFYAQFFQLAHNQLSFLSFILTGTGNAYQFNKLFNQSFFIQHLKHLYLDILVKKPAESLSRFSIFILQLQI